jgi:molybdate transport system substrate-binding protein
LAAALALLLAPLARAEETRLHVFAAASLGEAVDAIIDAWPGEAVGVYAGSSTLARQIELGGPADVYISANPEWSAHLAAGGALRGDPVDIASNALVAIGAPGVDAPLARLIAGPQGRLAIADPEGVPAGIYARQALTGLGLWKGGEGLLIGASVREALAWVSRGEAEIGIVYRTDAMLAPGLAMDEIDPSLHDPIRYVAAATATADPMAEAFLAFLAGPEAQAILAGRGFGPPLRSEGTRDR